LQAQAYLARVMKGGAKMASYGSNRGRLWLVVMAALGGALVSLVTFVQWERPAQAIAGGTAVPDGKYPFIALMNVQRKSDGAFLTSCGASLIDQDSVLTAAHCLYGLFNPKSHKLQVYVGRTVRSSNQGQVRSWKSIFIHPNYNPQKNEAYDAAVINLSSPVSGITPVKLATSSQNTLESPGRTATVAGWGNTFANPPDPPGRVTRTACSRRRRRSTPTLSGSRLTARATYLP
jgi:secreted trypsin-like serine protease